MTEATLRNCFLCQSKGEFYARVETHDYLRCAACGLVYVDAVESPEKLYRSYDGGFWKALRRKLFMPVRSFEGARHFDRSMERANRIFDLVLASNAHPGKSPVYLDIGCNKGFLLAAAISHGWNVYGVELVPELTIPFKQKFQTYAGQIYSFGFEDAQIEMKDGTFDAITAIDVIEHFIDPAREMGNIYRVLKPGGVFLIQTPDTDNPQAGELKEAWGALKPREHLHLFNRRNLEAFARKLGFRNVKFFDAIDTEDGNFVAVLQK